MIKHGQIWENGRAIAQVLEADGDMFRCVKLEIEKGSYRFSGIKELGRDDMVDHLKSLGMKPTDKLLDVHVGSL